MFFLWKNTLFLVAPTAVKIVDPGEGGGLVVGRRYDITCRAWGSRPPASLTWYLGVTRLGREYSTWYLGVTRLGREYSTWYLGVTRLGREYSTWYLGVTRLGREYLVPGTWGSRPPASLTWYLGVTRLGREYTVPGIWGSRPPASLTWYLGVTRLGREYSTWYLGQQTASQPHLVPGSHQAR